MRFFILFFAIISSSSLIVPPFLPLPSMYGRGRLLSEYDYYGKVKKFRKAKIANPLVGLKPIKIF